MPRHFFCGIKIKLNLKLAGALAYAAVNMVVRKQVIVADYDRSFDIPIDLNHAARQQLERARRSWCVFSRSC
jgi:hypothetical protein